MEFTRLGRTGLRVSRIGLGCLSYGQAAACPIVGATKPHHLWDAVAALEVRLTEGEIAELEAPYLPQDNYWW